MRSVLSNMSNEQNGYRGQTKKKAAGRTRGKQLNKVPDKSIHPKKFRKRNKANAKDTKQEQNLNLTHTHRFFVGTLLPLRTSTTPFAAAALNRVFSVVGSNLGRSPFTHPIYQIPCMSRVVGLHVHHTVMIQHPDEFDFVMDLFLLRFAVAAERPPASPFTIGEWPCVTFLRL
jgi:hypothetical protein